MVSKFEDEFDFDDDEKEHYQVIEDDIIETLDFAKTASLLTLNSLVLSDSAPRINTAASLVTFLMAKTANSIRNAVKGLKLGYYSSTATVLRSALESLSFAYLFDSNPNEVASWLRNEFSNRPLSELCSLQNDQAKKAIHNLLDSESQPKVIAEALHRFKKTANKHIHATLEGLGKEFNIDIETLLPDEIVEAKGDLDEALSHYALLSVYGEKLLISRTKSDEKRTEDEMIWIHYANRYIKDEIFDLSMIAFYIAHRLLDLTQSFSISDRDFQHDYKEWHKESKNRGTSVD
ncbi:hypothetical protein ACFL4C_02395 [Candidatus Omnitrophota bacterium]